MHKNTLKQRAKDLRSNQTDIEKKFWYQLRASRFEKKKFYRQFVIEPYIVDFVQRDLKLIIELDGGQHQENRSYDDRRTDYLERKGYKVIRFWNNEVAENLNGVLSALSLALSQRERELKNSPNLGQAIPISTPELAKRVAHRNNSSCSEIWNILDNVFDPELPGLSIWDLGILQNVQLQNWVVLVTATPTYSGCPAVDTIVADIKTELAKSGYKKVEVSVTLSPAWTTDMMSPEGKRHLKSIQIAPPNAQDKVSCPICESENTKVLSQFGSTACKSLYQCNDCLEAFDYFKHF